MKTIKKLTAMLACIAAAGSLASVPVSAEGETTTTTETAITINAKAVAAGYSSEQTNNEYDSDNDQIQLGGSYAGNPAGTLADKYTVPTGADQIIYNEANDVSSKDTRVSYLRFTLPDDVTDTDTYTLTMVSAGVTNNNRNGAMDIYAGIADVNTAVVSDATKNADGAPGTGWTDINWKRRPVVNGAKSVATAVDITNTTSTISLNLTEVLKGQKAGEVTVALLSKQNSTTNSQAKFKDVTLTRTEPAYAATTKVSPAAADGQAKDAVGFKYNFNVTEGNAVKALTWQITYSGQTRTLAGKIPTVSGGDCTIGLVITDIPAEVSVDSITANVVVQ